MHEICEQGQSSSLCDCRTIRYHVAGGSKRLLYCRFAAETKDRACTDQNLDCNGNSKQVVNPNRLVSIPGKAAIPTERGPLQTLKQRSAERNAQARTPESDSAASLVAQTQPCSIAKGICNAAIRKSQADAAALAGRQIFSLS